LIPAATAQHRESNGTACTAPYSEKADASNAGVRAGERSPES